MQEEDMTKVRADVLGLAADRAVRSIMAAVVCSTRWLFPLEEC